MINDYIQLTLRLVAFSIFIQNLEFVYIYLKNKQTLITQYFFYYSLVTLFIAAYCIFLPDLSFAFYFLISLIYQFHFFKGIYNGGSTSMTQQVVIALCVAYILKMADYPLQFSIYYIAVQSIASYFIAGLVKIKEPEWRNGQMIIAIIKHSHYQIPNFIAPIIKKQWLAFLAAWVTMLFELSSPYIIFNKIYLIPFFCFLISFHLMNAFIFGINRFTYAWLATYPAIYYLAHQI